MESCFPDVFQYVVIYSGILALQNTDMADLPSIKITEVTLCLQMDANTLGSTMVTKLLYRRAALDFSAEQPGL